MYVKKFTSVCLTGVKFLLNSFTMLYLNLSTVPDGFGQFESM